MNIALIAAAGQGKRMKEKTNKQFLTLFDKPILAHSLSVFEDSDLIDEIVVIVREDERLFCQKEVIDKYGFSKVKKIVAGGSQRQYSIQNALEELDPRSSLVIVHDGARPLLKKEDLEGAIALAKEKKAVILGAPVKNTIKQIGPEKKVLASLERSSLYQIQTPQIFQADLLQRAYKKAREDGFLGTDDSSLVERISEPVFVYETDYENIKITTPEDLDLARLLLRRRGK